MRKTDHVGRNVHSGNAINTENKNHIPKLSNLILTERNVSLLLALAYSQFISALCLKLSAVLRESCPGVHV